MTRILFATATGMAAFLDATVGMLIVHAVAQLMGVEIPIWYLLVGSILALLPDFDLVLKALSAWQQGNNLRGDHRSTIMHIPIVMLPCYTFAAWVLGGQFWAVTTFLCLFYHYVHDSRIFSVGDVDWFWTGRELPWMETPEWLKQYWLRPTKTSALELLIGSAVLTYVVSERLNTKVAVAITTIVIVTNIMTWLLYRRTQ